MKPGIFVFIICVSLFTSCKSPKVVPLNTTVSKGSNTEQPAAASRTAGKISHQYSAGGCAVVIVISDPAKPSILIPKNKLPENLDVDGLEIYFNYHTLKMKQPAGCTEGIPADLTNITKK